MSFLFICRQVIRAALGLDEVHKRVERGLENLADVALEVAFEAGEAGDVGEVKINKFPFLKRHFLGKNISI